METAYETRDDYLLCIVSGPLDADTFNTLWPQLFQAASDSNRRQVLIDAREVVAKLTATDRYEIGACYAALRAQLGSRVRAALVGRAPFVEDGRLGQKVAQNRGADVIVTTDIDEARAWLALSESE